MADNVDSSLHVHCFHPGLSEPVGSPGWNSFQHLEGVIRSARLLSLRRNFTATERERDKCPSGQVSTSATVCVCVGIRQREKVAFPHGRLSLGIASTEKLSFLLSIRRELSLYFGPCHLQRKPQETATLEFFNTGSDQFLLAQTYRLL